MKRSLTIRVFVGVLLITATAMLFSYVRAKASREADPTSEMGKCSSANTQTEFILWGSLLHNLLNAKP
jgi:hypothetical protein